MDVIKMARDLGAELQKGDAYIGYSVAKEAADNDAELQKLIGEFNLKKVKMSEEIQKEEKDEAKLQEINEELKKIYNDIMNNPNMIAYNTTKGQLDKVLNFIQQIIVYSANGEDPYTVEEESSCTGSCSSCSGCH